MPSSTHSYSYCLSLLLNRFISLTWILRFFSLRAFIPWRNFQHYLTQSHFCYQIRCSIGYSSVTIKDDQMNQQSIANVVLRGKRFTINGLKIFRLKQLTHPTKVLMICHPSVTSSAVCRLYFLSENFWLWYDSQPR